MKPRKKYMRAGGLVPETQIAKEIRDVLLLNGVDCWITHDMRHKPLLKGMADISGIQIGTGIRVEVEVKRPGEKTTADQDAFLARINAAGGIAFIATSAEEAMEFYRLHKEIPW
jgi:hypothetical protein